MADRLKEALHGKQNNYIMPFLWMHGNNAARLQETVDVIHQAGVGAVCVESRPHPDFVGPLWWNDMDAVMAQARQHNMKVWLLDDQFFPSGCAAGQAAHAQGALQKWSLVQDCIDVPGPQPCMRFAIGGLVNQLRPPQGAKETTCEKRLLAVIACSCEKERDALLTQTRINLTAQVDADGFLRWDVPQGAWRIVVVVAMTNACLDFNAYVNFLHCDSVRILLDAIYEPHFKRYQADFGETFAGFFSDEPGFYTGTTQLYPLQESIGQRDLPLPWTDEVLSFLATNEANALKELPLLWYDSAQSAAFRGRYLDAITQLYQKNYVQQVGDWCEAHGVAYIGHVLEDNNSHVRLGCGAGHYFRAMQGQHMSGIDVVFNQIYPGRDYEETCHRVMDGQFNHYALAKLASSSARLEPRMQGRAMAEVFGAGGWAEGLSLMKWVADSLLVRGINVFVPHAYSPKDFPDADCPPHFYAQGNNPQHPYMHKLYHHMNRAAHLLPGKETVIHTAILYHAQAEWQGAAMPVQIPARACMQHQIDFDIISEDHLMTAITQNGTLCVCANVYRALVIPCFDHLPVHLLETLLYLHRQGANIVFLDKLPASPEGNHLLTSHGCRICTVAALPQLLAAWHCKSIEPTRPCPGLRCLHSHQEQRDVFFLFNELVGQCMTEEICFCVDTPLYAYDCMENRLSALPQTASARGQVCTLHLAPYQSVFLVTHPPEDCISPLHMPCGESFSLTAPWQVSLDRTQTTFSLPTLRDLSSSDLHPNYSGTIVYETKFTWNTANACATLELGQAYEAVEVTVNGRCAGVRICPPYSYTCDGLLTMGENTLTIRVATTLFNRLKDPMSLRLPIPPTGLLGPVTLCATTPIL